MEGCVVSGWTDWPGKGAAEPGIVVAGGGVSRLPITGVSESDVSGEAVSGIVVFVSLPGASGTGDGVALPASL